MRPVVTADEGREPQSPLASAVPVIVRVSAVNAQPSTAERAVNDRLRDMVHVPLIRPTTFSDEQHHSTFAFYAAASAHARWTWRISALVG